MLKPFGPGDFDAYLDMSRAFYASEATDHPVPESHFRRTFGEILTHSPLARGWIVIVGDDRPAGYLLASLTWSNEFGGRVAWMEELYLRPEARGRGVGRRVLEAALEELKARDKVAGFRLEVAPANVSVSELYRRLGFTPVPYQGWWMAAD